MSNRKQRAALSAFALLCLAGTAANAQEIGENTPYYEDDALLDITEWFDGNDYNPTDEAWWRWDNETYQAFMDVSEDRDGDLYGYLDDDEDWFYDYYDPYDYDFYDANDDDLYDYGWYYQDYGNDGDYDALISYGDWDSDGFYEDYNYYYFPDAGDGKTQQASQTSSQPAKESKQRTLTGEIQKTKTVMVRGGAEHVIVGIQPDSGTGMVIADLGPSDDLKNWNPTVGNTISVTGPKTIVGEQGVILARSFEADGKTVQVDRSPPTFHGEVLSTHMTDVRGTEHLLAMIEGDANHKMQKIAVDLGPSDRLMMDIKKGTNLTLSGFPVKVKVDGGEAKSLLMAQSVTVDGKFVRIDRRPDKPADTTVGD